MQNYKYILFEIEDGVGKISLNNPSVLNSFNREMAKELQDILSHCSENPAVRAIYLTAEGRAFCAGQDLQEVMPAPNPEDTELGETVKLTYNPIVKKIRHTEKPVICAVNGTAAGAGANIAIACDITFAAESASFIQSFSKIGLIPDSGGTFFLPRLVGMQQATAMMFLGNKIKAKEALDLGMIYKVCADDELQQEALATAQQLAKMPTKGFGLTKRGLNRAMSNDLTAQLEFEEKLQNLAGKTYDYSEGVNAFIEKRPANYKGE